MGIKSLFILGRFVCLHIGTILSMFRLGFEFCYTPLRSNFWIVSNSVWQDLASLEFVWTFLKFQTWSLVPDHCTHVCSFCFSRLLIGPLDTESVRWIGGIKNMALPFEAKTMLKIQGDVLNVTDIQSNKKEKQIV